MITKEKDSENPKFQKQKNQVIKQMSYRVKSIAHFSFDFNFSSVFTVIYTKSMPPV